MKTEADTGSVALDGKLTGIDSIDESAGENLQVSNTPLFIDTDKNQNSLLNAKDHEVVQQIKQELEGKRKQSIGRRRLSQFNLDWLFIRKPREYKLFAFVIFLLFIIITGLIVVYQFHEVDPYYIYYGSNISVNKKTLEIEIFNRKQTSVLKGRLWRTRPSGRLPYECSESVSSKDNGLCLIWKKMQQLQINDYQTNNATCYNVRWKALDHSVRHMDCYQLDSSGHWYGAGLLSVQQWPLERTSFNKQLFVTGTFHDRNSFGPVIERYWVTSSGVAIIVADNLPLHVSINSRPVDEHGIPTSNLTDRQLCLFADNTPALNYTICVGDNAKEIHQTIAGKFADQNQYTLIPSSFFADPVWSTWPLYKNSYNQSLLIQFAKKIKSTAFSAGSRLLLVDDGWEERYGDTKFDSQKFENPLQMMDDLHAEGFQVSLWFQPHLNTDSLSFQQATANGFLVRDLSGDVPGLTRWWNGPHSNPWNRGVAGLLDFSDHDANKWHHTRLMEFRKSFGIDQFHLAGGETVSWPLHSTVFTNTFPDPNDFTYHIVKLVSSLNTSNKCTVVQSAYRCQSLPVLVRISQGSSSWHNVGGLQSVIPSALSLGLIGYPFFIPEAIGGSAFNELPPKELYIRWLQIAAFFPIVHFSIPPDYYDLETASVAEKMMTLHKKLIVPTVLNLLNQTISNLSPIIRPLWWLAPTEPEALVTDNQFLVGDKILVAPIVEQGARYRTIYLPSGEWHDQITGQIFTGPMSLPDYPVPLDQVPYFVNKRA